MSTEIINVFTKLQDRCRDFEAENAILVNAWTWSDSEDVMVRITKHDVRYDWPDSQDEEWVYTMTCAFMVNGSAHCSVDVQDGSAEDVFGKMAMRMLQVG